jgi:hypothetical protein
VHDLETFAVLDLVSSTLLTFAVAAQILREGKEDNNTDLVGILCLDWCLTRLRSPRFNSKYYTL